MSTEASTIVTGHDAINIAENLEFVLQKYADRTEGARAVTVDEAREIAATDPCLVYLDLVGTNVNMNSLYLVDGRGNRRTTRPVDIIDAISEAEFVGADVFARVDGGETVCVWRNPEIAVT